LRGAQMNEEFNIKEDVDINRYIIENLFNFGTPLLEINLRG
jgi:hypothetical protein